jgi:uncharacterized protein (DUF1015 family)
MTTSQDEAQLYLNPWSRVVLENLTVDKLVKVLDAFYGTRTFIKVFKRARYRALFLDS